MEGNLSQKQTDIVRVVCFGPESTGKTTLCKALAEAFGTVWTPEFMRIYLEEKWQKHHQSCSWNDLLPIAYGQMALENEQVPKAKSCAFLRYGFVRIDDIFQNLLSRKMPCRKFKSTPPKIITTFIF
ncbi:hypothetical protein CCAN11_1020006 [Capnocytophaga canimorsus]|uniref:NadR/Ttd14 AAA domain-containing protein n=1 Tax=Capnocytophaga canimorsus TaxID=28188 RepID=A0A0B7I6G5_9FLAO|nr:ATP-binding protein [Capnocytophaga canimorsus]CEN46289.1 hypothetical protein CCAN11_1020006 [Capnocytophaga canimorsus]